VLDHQIEHDLIEVRTLVAGIPLPDLNDPIFRPLVPSVFAMSQKTRRIQVGKPGPEPEPGCRVCRQIAKKFGHAVVVETVESPSQGVIIEVLRLDSRSDQPVGRPVLEEPRRQI
jgi:hypothetical protein